MIDGEASAPDAEGEEAESLAAGAAAKPVEEPEIPARATGGKDFLKSVRDRLQPTGANAMKGGKLFGRKEVSFVLDGSAGGVGPNGQPVFSDDDGNLIDVEIVLHALTSGEEATALGDIKKAQDAPYQLAKAALCEIAETNINSQEDRDFWWEAIGQGGRQLCLVAFGHLGGASEHVMGKYQSTFTIK